MSAKNQVQVLVYAKGRYAPGCGPIESEHQETKDSWSDDARAVAGLYLMAGVKNRLEQFIQAFCPDASVSIGPMFELTDGLVQETDIGIYIGGHLGLRKMTHIDLNPILGEVIGPFLLQSISQSMPSVTVFVARPSKPAIKIVWS